MTKKCGRVDCKNQQSKTEHECPFQIEIHEDKEFRCRCCDDCTDTCRDDI